MTWIKLTSEDSGAPSLFPVNGSLTSLLRWALPKLGWNVEFGSTGNSAVFRAATGNRHFLLVRHESSITSGDASIACVRAGHTSTGATNIGSPFPTTTQVSNMYSTWSAGDPYASEEGSRWVIYGNNVFFHIFTYIGSGWDWCYFGDLPSDYATGYETVICVRNHPSGGAAAGMGAPANSTPYPGFSHEFWARGINATTISTGGNRQCSSNGSPLGRVPYFPVMRGGYQNRILREKVAVACTGSAISTIGPLSLPARGWLPNIWHPLHSDTGGVGEDIFTDSVYNPNAQFRVFNAPSYGTVIVEETDTWSKP